MTQHGTTADDAGGESSAGPERPVDGVATRLYEELRAMAGRLLGRDGARASVDATDLVHECYLRLARLEEFRMLGRAQFMSLAASILRGILVNLARRRGAQKRERGAARTTLANVAPELEDGAGDEVDLLDLDEALKRLESLDPRQHRVVELRFFGGLTAREIADQLGVSRRTVTKEWTVARAWLRREIWGAGPR